MDVAKIEKVPIREAFPHEAHNFTVWLENNIDTLSEQIGLELTVVEREKSVGSFNVDLLCDDANGENVIIENQLERTDHSHLGQLLTYLVNLDAKTAIWVATNIRPEHLRVIDWLNETTGEDMGFYAVQVEAIRIGNSPYAPLFTVMAQPDNQTREIGKAKKDQASRDRILIQFWEGLLEIGGDRLQIFSNVTPGDRWNLSTGSGKAGFTVSFNLFRDGYGGQIYIDTGDKDRNKAIFDALYTEHEAIERDIGFQLDWLRLDNKRASRIRFMIEKPKGYNWSESKTWYLMQRLMVDHLIEFHRVLSAYIRQLDI